MPASSRSISVPWGALFFATLGLAWCGYVAFPTATLAPCPTSGCTLFRDTRVFGLSLWWIGGAYFFFLSLLCLRGKRLLAWWLARLALLLDSVLLLVMFFTAPCSDCLVVAVFFALTLVCLKPKESSWFSGKPVRLFLLPVWFGLFLGNASLAVNETMHSWVLGNTENTSVRIYFSPSCPACREALLTFGTSVALYPIAEKDSDYDAILRLDNYLSTGVPLDQALSRCLNPEAPVPHTTIIDRMLMRIRLTRNNAAVLKQGFKNLPLIQINGMPKNWQHAKTTTPSAPVPSPQETTGMPWDTNLLGQCEQNATEPCEEPSSPALPQ